MERKPIIEGKGIFDLIPQRPPIVMVDQFFGMEEERSYTGLTILPDNIFCREGVFQEAGIIEHIAQSAAARIGYIYILKKEPVPLGFIGSVDKMEIYRLPEAGQELYTQVTVLQEVFDITLIAAEVTVGDTPVAGCKMKIFLSKG